MAVSKLIYLTSLNRACNAHQRYYLMGLREYCKKQTISIRRKIRATAPFLHYNEFVGQYVFQRMKFAIDAHDGKDIASPEILEWADIYFKSSKWKSVDYPAKVLPIGYGSVGLTSKRIKYLQNLRRRQTYDLTFIFRVWAGREHSIRLFEQVAKVNCNKNLLAIFVKKEKKEYEDRLIKAGVPFTFSRVPWEKLQEAMACSRWVLLRAGKHLCVPSRMVESLCLGASIIVDHDPYPQWPMPLVNGKNYLSLNIDRTEKSSYELIPSKINEVLNDISLQEKICQNNLNYFANYARPLKIAEYIFATIKKAQ